MLKIFDHLKQLAHIALAIAAAGLCFYLWPVARRVNTASHDLLDCRWYDSKEHRMRSNPACLQARIEGITGSINASAGAIAKNMPEIAKGIGEASRHSAEASGATVDLAKASTTLVKSTNEVIASAKQPIQDLSQVARGLTAVEDEARQTVADLRTKTIPLVNGDFSKLGANLDETKALTLATTRTISGVGDLVSDPNWKPMILDLRESVGKLPRTFDLVNGTLGNTQRATGYVADMLKPQKSGFLAFLAGRVASSAAGPLAGSFVSHFFPQRVSIPGTVKVKVEEK